MAKEWHDSDDFWAVMEAKIFPKSFWQMAFSEVNNIIKLIKLKPKSSVLDLACGPGRHTIQFADRDYNVTGVDRTARYLKEARAIAKRKRFKIEYVKCDMRKFVRKSAFDAVVNLYTSFGYFKDPSQDSHVLRNIFRSLKPGGKLVIELMGQEVLKRIFIRNFWYEDNGIYYLTETSPDKNWCWLNSRWIMIKNGKPKEYKFVHRVYSGPMIKKLLHGVGFKGVKLYGGLNGTPYDSGAKRLVAVATK